MNRLWHLWCALSGADPSDTEAKTRFNVDRRVATLSAHNTDLVEGFATFVWNSEPGMTSHIFLARLLAEMTEDQEQREDPDERARATAAAEAREAEHMDEEVFFELLHDRVERDYNRSVKEALLGNHEEAQCGLGGVREEIRCLYNIAPVVNLARIASRGLLCHDLAKEIRHDDVSDEEVQDRRVGRSIAGRPLHSFANLYINPRNAMMFRLLKEKRDVVVLEISADVLDLPGAFITDGNAASGSSRSWPAADGLARIDLTRIRSRDWWRDGGEVDSEVKRIMQAEVLIPDSVSPEYIEGFLAPSQETLDRALEYVAHWDGRVSRHMFFA